MTATPSIDPPDLRALRRFRNRAADRYDDSAVLVDEVASRLFSRLDLVRLPPGPILDLGCASGTWSARLGDRYPGVDVFGVDIADSLVRRAQARAASRRSWLSRLTRAPSRFVCAEFDRLPWRPGSFSLVWSNLVAPWFRDPPAAWRQIGSVLKPGGLLAFSTLGPDTLREVQRAWLASGRPPATLPFADMHDIGDALVRAGFAAPVMDVDVLQVTYRSVEAMVRDARDQGALNVQTSRPRGLMTPDRWNLARDRLKADPSTGFISLTFEVVFGHAWWPESGPRKTAEGLDVVRIQGRTKP